jgi:hypothetical protein
MLVERSPAGEPFDTDQLFNTLEQRALDREIGRVRKELQLTEEKIQQLEQRVSLTSFCSLIVIVVIQFENSDQTVQFNIERLKLKCDVLRQHIDSCNNRLEHVNQQVSISSSDPHRDSFK